MRKEGRMEINSDEPKVDQVATSWTENRNVHPPSRCTTIYDLPSLVAPGGGVGGVAGVGVAAEVLLATLLALLRLASLLGGALLELGAAELLVSTELLVAAGEAAATTTVATIATLLAALAVIVVASLLLLLLLLLHAFHACTVASVGRCATVHIGLLVSTSVTVLVVLVLVVVSSSTVVVAAAVSAVAASAALVVVAAVVVLVVSLLLVGLSVSAEPGSLELLAVHVLLVSGVAVSLADVGLAVGVLVPHGRHTVHAARHSLLHAGSGRDAGGLAALLLVLVVGGSATSRGGGTVDATGIGSKARGATRAGGGLGLLLTERSAEAHAIGSTVHAHTSVGRGTISLRDLLLGLSRGGLGLGSGRSGGGLGLGAEGGRVELGLEVLNVDNSLRGHWRHHATKSRRRAGGGNAGGGGLGLGNLRGEGLRSGRGGRLAGRGLVDAGNVATLGLTERTEGKVDALVLVTLVGVPLAEVEDGSGLLLSGSCARRSTSGRELGGVGDLGAGHRSGVGRTDDGRGLGNGRISGRGPSGGIDVGASD
mmetsp:Transcript_24779/g.71598  ORF Transcript_24779/g.71598 Transcript_24779/m.71598 type:complete len:539 (-) Transcript_24779:1214-2830(-)